MSLQSSVLLTDLYQLTMLHGYYARGMDDTAVFEFFVRDLPPERRFLVAVGLEQALAFLDNAHFTDEELTWLRERKQFPSDFVDYLAQWRFTGEVHAMPEGTVFFPDEPILRVTAPIGQAQLVESRLINLLHYQSLIASKAVRCTLAAPDKLLVDFGMRRAHGAEAGLLAARASYIAGFAGSATVLAAQRFGLPAFGTMAHSYIEAHADEIDAFESFARAQPDNVTLLIDTYDTEAGAEEVVALARRLRAEGIAIRAVRLDSGNLDEHAHRVRAILDDGGLQDVRIFSSGNLDEHRLQKLLAAGAPIDGFGVGTLMDTSADVPYLDCAYKLTEYAGRGRRKRSESKATWPGRKQVYRHYDTDGRMAGDTVTLSDAPVAGDPLLEHVMAGGRRIDAGESLDTIRTRLRGQLERLPDHLRRLEPVSPDEEANRYPVTISPALRQLAEDVDAELEAGPAQRRTG